MDTILGTQIVTNKSKSLPKMASVSVRKMINAKPKMLT